MYGVISAPKFKLLFTTLLLWIIAHFYTLIFNFYNSTLPIHNSVSIFQVQCGSLTCNILIHIQYSKKVGLYGAVWYACNAIWHSCFPHSQSISIFCSQIFSLNMRHSCLCCGAEYDMPATQSNILLWTLNFTLEWPDLETVSRCTKYGGSK